MTTIVAGDSAPMETKNWHPYVRVPFPTAYPSQVRWYDHIWVVPLLTVVAAGDAVNFWIIIQLTQNTLTAWMAGALVLALTVAAVLLMHIAGTSMRNFKAGASAHGRVPAFLSILVWLGLGLVAFGLRWQASEPTASADVFGATVAERDPSAIFMAFLLLGLFIAGGVIAYMAAFTLHNPNRRVARRVRRSHRSHTRQCRKLRADIARRTRAVEQFDSDAAQLEDSLRAAGRELKQDARTRLSAAFGQPGSTTGIQLSSHTVPPVAATPTTTTVTVEETS